MKTKFLLKSVLLVGSLALGGNSFAGDGTTQAIARILVTVKHLPSAADVSALGAIAADTASSADEKTVAQVVASLKHFPSAEDKAKLQAIVDNAKAEPKVKILATALLGFQHMLAADSPVAVIATAK